MVTFIFLFLLWIILNGRVTLEICLFGIAIAGAIYGFAFYALGYRSQNEKGLWKRLGIYAFYALALIVEIFKANFNVMRIILTSRPDYHPAIVKVRIPLKKQASRLLLANSITLTPGTVTVEEKNGLFTVLCLDKSHDSSISDWYLVRILQKLEDTKWN